MSASARTPRGAEWLESLGEWSWPGQRVATAEVLPPSWVPAQPPVRAAAQAPALPAPWVRARRLTIALLLGAVVLVGGALALQGQLGLLGSSPGSVPARASTDTAAAGLLPSFKLVPVSTDQAGSAIEKASYRSVSLHHTGSFYVYLPPGYSTGKLRYPVIYLLHGNSQSATAFLQIGLQGELDRLIARHTIPPMIAVMIQGGPGANNWRNLNGLNYESYVLEVQEMIDHGLRSVPARGDRAIAGLSMGGYGAMELTLDNPYRFGVVESWLGFFDGLEDQLHIDRQAISSLGLHAFVYGGEEDHIANPAEDAPFAAKLRAEGAKAQSALFPGEHSLETVQAHLTQMLTFAGQSLSGTRANGAS
jgi:enterochelin esterase-like enzyme